jgi:hypothetical protein
VTWFVRQRHIKRLAAAAQAAGLSPAAWSRRLVLDQLAGGTSGGALAGATAAAAASASEHRAAAAAAAAPPAEPLSRMVGVKLTASQYFDLSVRANGAGAPIGAYLRRLILGQPPTACWRWTWAWGDRRGPSWPSTSAWGARCARPGITLAPRTPHHNGREHAAPVSRALL